MLILKGDKGKSRFLCTVIGNNLCFKYSDSSVYFDGYWLCSLNYSIDEFKDYIKACLYDDDKSRKNNLYDYLIIYTNEKEEVLRDFISWLKDNEQRFLCEDILLTCK